MLAAAQLLPALRRCCCWRRPPPLLVPLVPLVLLAALLLAAAAHVAPSLGRSTCRMAWMSPAYVLLPGMRSADPHASRWRLLLYREQGWDQPGHAPEGQPVLYIPGNAGSYQQARSIASSATRQFYSAPGVRNPAFDGRGLGPVDVFTLDFNEALSALHGPTLLAQSAYVASAIPFILSSAYAHLPPDARPTSVVLVGHSMGGIVGRHAVTRLVDPTQVDTVLTLSSPHQLAPVAADAALARAYADIATFFSLANQLPASDAAAAALEAHPASSHLLVSVCGGAPDPTLSSDACALPPSSFAPPGALGVFTTALEGAWTGVDHEAMVWCDQVRTRVARVLLELGGRERGGRREARRRVASDWLVGQALDHKDERDGPADVEVDVRSDRKVVLGKPTDRFVLPPTDASAPSSAAAAQTLVLFPLGPASHTPLPDAVDAADDRPVFQLVSNLAFGPTGARHARRAQLVLCPSTTPASCAPLPDLVARERLPPSAVGGAPWVVGEGVGEDEGMTWVEVRVRGAGWVGVRVAGGEGGAWGVGQAGQRAVGEETGVKKGTFAALLGFSLPLTGGNDGLAPIRRTLELPALLSHSLLVYRATFDTPQDCKDTPLFAPLLRHTTRNALPAAPPITHESAFYPSPSAVLLHSHSSSAPFLPPTPGPGGLALEYWSDPTAACGPAGRVRVRLAVRASASRLALRYRMTAVAWVVGVVAGVLALQAGRFRADGTWPPLLESLSLAIKSHGVHLLGALTLVQLVQLFAVRLASSHGWTHAAALASEALLGNHHAVLLLLPAALASAIAGLVVIVLAALAGWVRIGSACGRYVDRRGWLFALPRVDDLARGPPRKRQLTPVLVLLLAVATIIPYQGAVLILFLVHALSTLAAQPPPPAPLSAAATRPSASPTPASLTSAAPASRASQYVSVLALVLCGLLPTSAPVLAVWARDVLADWREPFTGDHNVLRVVGVVGNVAACEGGRFLAPDRKDHPSVRLLEGALLALSAFAFVFGSRYLYRVYDLANVCLALLAVGLWTTGA